MATARLHRGLVALSASAVAAVYMAGYLRTQAADGTIGAATAPPAAAEVADGATAITALAPTVVPTPQPFVLRQTPISPSGSPPPSPSAPTPTPAAVAQSSTTASHYKDGTYTGQGTSRRGDVWVSVQVQGGRIANVTITRSTLQYPLRDIANLPSQVVQRQSAQVDVVSRATYSSMAFRGAISQALAGAAA
ncbi:MAG: hypothetical protein NVSMB2_21510 [Chloroflexota bacterium]